MSECAGWTIVEDETLCDISIHDVEPPLPIAALGGSATVLSIRSACKLFWGGLRIGWVRGEAHHDQSHRAAQDRRRSRNVARRAKHCAPKLLPLRDRVRKERREQLALRYRTLVGALERELPSWSRNEPCGGSSSGSSCRTATRRASRSKRRASASPSLRVPFSRPPNGTARRLRLPFVLDPDVLVAGVETPGCGLGAYAPRAATLPLDAVV